MKKIYLSLGSNLGAREENLQQAVDRLAEARVHVLRVSSTYETAPMYVTQQPMFLNIAVEGETDSFPRLLLRRLQSIEHEMGRRRLLRNGPRPIDIDILFFGRFVIHAQDLVVPHPHLAERRFVLEPLAELVPELRHPVSKQTIRELLREAPEEGVRKVAFRVRTTSQT